VVADPPGLLLPAQTRAQRQPICASDGRTSPNLGEQSLSYAAPIWRGLRFDTAPARPHTLFLPIPLRVPHPTGRWTAVRMLVCASPTAVWMLVCASLTAVRMLVCASPTAVRMLVCASLTAVRMLLCASLTAVGPVAPQLRTRLQEPGAGCERLTPSGRPTGPMFDSDHCVASSSSASCACSTASMRSWNWSPRPSACQTSDRSAK